MRAPTTRTADGRRAGRTTQTMQTMQAGQAQPAAQPQPATRPRPALTTHMPLRTAVRLELAKTRRLRVWPLALLLGVVTLLLSAPLTASGRESLTTPGTDPWPALLLSVSLMSALVSPVLVAVTASRLTDVEHTGAGWTLAATAGLTPGRACRAKALALALVLAPAVAIQVGGPVLTTLALNPPTRPDATAWCLYALSLLAVDTAAGALHVLLSAAVENQVLCVGVGFLGSFVAVFSLLLPPSVARLLPWGYWALITPTRMVGDASAHTSRVVYDTPDWPWVIGFLLLVGAVTAVATTCLSSTERTAR